MKRKLLIVLSFIALLGSTLEAQAQSRSKGFEGRMDFSSYEIAVSTSYEMPLGFLQHMYKPTSGYMLSGTSFQEDKGYGIIAGYMKFTPSQDIFYYMADDYQYGTAEYGDYTIYILGTTLKWSLPLPNTDALVPYTGLDVAYYVVDYSVNIDDPYGGYRSGVTEGKGGLAPHAGLNFYFTDWLGVFVQSKLNVFFSMGSSDINSFNYNEKLGIFDFTLSNSIGLKLRFN